MEQSNNREEGSILRGFLGALAGALIGSAIWAAVGAVTGYIYSLVGLLIGFLTVKGYDLCGGRKGAVRIVIVLVLLILSVVIGEVLMQCWFIHEHYEAELLNYPVDMHNMLLTEKEFMIEMFLDPEFQSTFLSQLLTSLAFAGAGALSLIRLHAKKKEPQNVNFDEANDE